MPVWAAAADLLPHRALYEVSLADGGRSGSTATGAVATTLERTCDGWIVTTRMTADLSLEGEQSLAMDIRVATWESGDFRDYRFAVRNKVGQLQTAFKGSANAPGDGQGATVTYTVPTDGTLSLPDGVVFPLGHLSMLIDRARAGDRLVSATVFDGTEDVGARPVTAFIRESPPIDPETAGIIGDNMGDGAWFMRAAYFKPGDVGAAPEYEVEVLQLDNGIAAAFSADYGLYAMQMDLRSLEVLSLPSC